MDPGTSASIAEGAFSILTSPGGGTGSATSSSATTTDAYAPTVPSDRLQLVFVFQNLFVTEHEMVLIRNATVAYLQKHGRDFLAVKKLWRKTAGCDLLKDDLGWEDVLLPQGRKMTLPFSTLGGLPGTAG